MNTGKIIRLNNYCVIEYIIPDPNEVQSPISADFTVLHNKYTGDVQFFNGNNDITGNIQDYTVVKTNGNTYVNVDVDKVPNFLDYDSNYIYTEPSTDPFKYDIVRFHFISGFSFTEFTALIFTIKNQLNNGQYGIFSQFILTSLIMSDVVKFNTQPIFLSDAFFDRYFEIKIPSIKQMNIDYDSSSNKSTTLGALLSPKLNNTEDGFNGYIGYVTDFPINITLSESNTYVPYTPDTTTYDTYIIDKSYELSIEQTNDYDGLSAYIEESTEGNYIEYSLKKDDAFPNEFISYLNSKNSQNNWIIIHDLRVYEHVGSSEILTNSSMFYQYDDFEEYLKYRPVLKYAENAIAFSIDYTVRLTNTYNGEQVIRTGGVTLYDPKSYGKDTRALIADITAQPYKVYNKILLKKGLDKTDMYTEPVFNDVPNPPASSTENEVKYVTKYVPYVVNFIKVGLSSHSAYDKKITSDSFVYGQGKHPLVISPMDNIFKFIIYEQDSDGAYQPMDLNIAKKYKLVFRVSNKEININTKSNVVSEKKTTPDLRDDLLKNAVPPLESNVVRSGGSIRKKATIDSIEKLTGIESVGDGINELSNTKNGELVFKLPKKEAQILYKGKSDEFYITMLTEDGTETVLYRGRWYKMSEEDAVTKKEKDARLNPIDVQVKDKFEKSLKTKSKEVTGATSVKTGSNKSTSYDPKTNTIIADDPKIEVPGYNTTSDVNKNIPIITKIKPRQVLNSQ